MEENKKVHWNKGRKATPETKLKMSLAHKGRVVWNKGIPVTEEVREKLRKASTGKRHTPEELKKMSESQLGEKNHRFGKKHTEEWKAHISNISKGRPKTEEHRRKMSEACKGEKSHFWKGGITHNHTVIRQGLEYKLWRTAVFERDNYTCIWCNARSVNGKAVTIQADHIKPFAMFSKLRFSIDNGRTLCVDCHKKTNTYGVKSNIKL